MTQTKPCRFVLAEAGQKWCGACQSVKPLTAFNGSKRTWDSKCTKCAECSAQANRLWRENNPGAFSKWHAENKEHRSQYFKDWRQQNLEHLARRFSAWDKANRPKRIARKARRKAAKRQAAVAWADEGALRVFYEEAARLTRETGVRHEVDHIYPLQGELVCGLHCEANLQILTKEENIRKLNRMPEDHYLRAAA